MKKLILIFIVLICLTGCDIFNTSEIPAALNSAKRPLTLIAKGFSGVLITDADGNLYSYGKKYYFAQVIMSSELEPGDIISGEREPEQLNVRR